MEQPYNDSLPPEFYFPSIIESYNQRYAPIVYRLIDAALIFFFMIPSYFKFWQNVTNRTR